MAIGLDANGVYTIGQAEYQATRDIWAATGNPGSLSEFLFQMLTQGGRGIAGSDDKGYSAYPQIVADLSAHGIDVSQWGLPTVAQVTATPTNYPGVNPVMMPQPAPGPTPPTAQPVPVNPLTGAPVRPPDPTALDPDQLGSFRSVKQFLDEVGLGNLASLTDNKPGGWLWDEVTKKGLKTHDEVQGALDQNAQWRERFQVHYDQLQQVGQGKPVQVLSAGEIRQYEKDAADMMRAFNMPPNLYDDYHDFQQLMRNGVSPQSLNKAITVSWNRVANSSPQVRQAFTDLYGPHGDQLMASYFLDNAQFESKIDLMSRAASLKGTANQIGFDIGRPLAEELAGTGLEGETARTGLAQVGAESQLFDENISETKDLTPETGVKARFGLDAQAARDVADRAGRRSAALGGGGGGIVTAQGDLASRSAT